MKKWRIILVIFLTFILISFAFSFIVIKDFSGPLAGITGIGPVPSLNHDPVDVHEYTAFYFAKNLNFNPLPQLNLINNQAFYPYGTNNVFIFWMFEADIFYSIFHSFFPTGPLLQIYYLITVLITAVGAFVLLFRDYGVVRALGASFFASFGNFYAFNKYSHHLTVSIVHWTILSLIADFLIVKRVVLRRRVSLRLILVRSCLLLLTFGQELGYMTGFGLMSLTVSIIFITLLTCYRYFKGDVRGGIDLIRREIEAYKIDFFAAPWTCLVLLLITLIAAYMYLPLTIQIAREVKSFNLSSSDFGYFSVNPLRLLLPYFPGINNPKNTLENIFRDSPEAIGAGSPGWFLLIVGAIGLWQSRKQITSFIPLLSIFILCVLYVPQPLFSPKTLVQLIALILACLSLWFTRNRRRTFVALLFVIFCLLYIYPSIFLLPTLKIFPWFNFNRVAGRSTVIYSIILGIFALHINLGWLSSPKRQLVTGLLVILACTELATAYSFRLYYQQPVSLNKDFFAYMDYVRKQPGEAVLDWPFSIISGGGTKSMGWLGGGGAFALRRFHDKKVIGGYFGRLLPSQIEPFLQAGWERMFLPDRTNSRQRRCFNQQEWSFFTDFYKLNDFAGINLFVEQFPEECLKEFYTRFGNPVVETVVPGVGKVKFIPKSAELRSQVNLVSGVNLKFKPPVSLDLSDFKLLEVNNPHGLTMTGLSEIKKDEQDNYYRLGYNTETLLSFKLSEPQYLELALNFNAQSDFYDVLIEINGVIVEKFSNIKLGNNIKRNIKFEGVEGANNIIFKYQKNTNVNVLNDIVKSIKSEGLAFFNNNYLKKKYKLWTGNIKEVIQFNELSILEVSKESIPNAVSK